MTSTRRTWWRVLALLAVLGLVAAACGDDGDGEEGGETTEDSFGEDQEEETDATAAYGGDIAVGLEAESLSWIPGEAQWTTGGLTVAAAIYDPLVTLNESGEYVPYLADTLTPNAHLSAWTITLRDGVTFHDGTALDAEALKWNFDTLLFADGRNTQGALQTAGVQDMVVVDDMTVEYQLDGPNAAFPDLLRGSIGMPISPTAYQADPDAYNNKPVGTGPFVAQEWVRDSYMRTTRNTDYWRTDDQGQQLPYLNSVEFRPIADESSRALSLQSNDIQVMQTQRGSTAKQVIALTDDENLDFGASTYVGNLSGSAIFNTLEPPVDDVRVRRALAMASDGELVAEVQRLDPFPPAMDWADGISAVLGHLVDTERYARGALDPHVESWNRIRERWPRDPEHFVPAHNDPNASNLLYDGSRLWLVDWETSAPNDPMVDLAVAANQLAPTPELVDVLLGSWKGEPPDDTDRARLAVAQVSAKLWAAAMLAAITAGRGASTDLVAPTMEEFGAAVASGSLSMATPEGLATFAAIVFGQFLAETSTPEFSEALRITSEG